MVDMSDLHAVAHAALDVAGLERLRAQFPVLAQEINGAPLAYLDNAATTQSPLSVQDAVRHFEQHDRANIHRGVHTLSQRATDAFDQARSTLKRFVGLGAAHELIFTSGTTDALNLVAHGLSTPGAQPAVIQPGDEIVVSALEHHANLVPWQHAARRCGARLRILMPDAQGRLHVEDLARLLTPRTRVFAVTACANATGERPPFEALLALAADAGALTVVGRRAALERLEPLRYGGDMVAWVSTTEASFAELPMRLEGGTPNVAGAVGLAAAADFIDRTGRSTIDAHVVALRAQAAAGLAALPGVQLLSADTGASAIVSFVAGGAHPHDIGTLLDEQGIAVRTGHHCAQPLLEHLGLGPTTRASFALYNTHAEVERLLAGVARALKVLQ